VSSAMPPLRALHWRTVEKVVLSCGYELYRTEGSHRVYVKDNEIKHVTVPTHKSIAPGALASIIRQMNLDRKRFLEIIEQVG